MPPSLIFTLYEKLQESPPAVAGVVICEVRLVVFDLFALSYLWVNSPKRWSMDRHQCFIYKVSGKTQSL